MANLALTSCIRRELRDEFNLWRHAVIPWMGTLSLVPVLFVTVYPVPPRPHNVTPYLFAAILFGGFGYMKWIESRHPGALHRGATMLVGNPLDPEGDVDWDVPAASPPGERA